jgi:hypothetical protein
MTFGLYFQLGGRRGSGQFDHLGWLNSRLLLVEKTVPKNAESAKSIS